MLYYNITKIATFYCISDFLIFVYLKKMRTAAKILFCSLIVSLGISCKKSDESIPNVPVNIHISISDPNYVALNAVGGWVYVTGGSKGIVMYCKALNEYMDYDRDCSYHPTDSNAKVDVDSGNILFLNDASCGSKFLITDG